MESKRWRRKLIRYQRRLFSLQRATRFPCPHDLDPGDRVEIRVQATVSDLRPSLGADGVYELIVVLDPHEAHITAIDRAER